ncbi:hypothetical protein [Kitasatospora viridis]|uniref:Uncharacterized protein n=1 Tax=Kitasatospora viridis TaxID=281105 RepID=A0A561TTJ5_9ACTN|nr:hypothetical protein [Kitasatospora viridis]TWF90407.1 hypothetical protein FHX73_13451 [Kitasatospora viridis]
MKLGAATAHGVRCLLALLDESDAARVGERLQLAPAEGTPSHGGWQALRHQGGSVLGWLLESDLPEVNRQLLAGGHLPPGLRRDVLEGVRFGPGGAGSGPLPPPVVEQRAGQADAPEAELPELPALIDQLRTAAHPGSLTRARAAAAGLRHAHWPELARADRERPLPGYARWALVEHLDCPDELRRAFGESPRYRHRLRQAGIHPDPRELFWCQAPAVRVAALLELGRWGFPERLAPVERELRALVRDEVGGNPEAWAVLAQLLPDFVGTLPELITTAGVIAGGPGG